MSLPCTSGIKPGWIVYALRRGFDGVFIAADGEECGYLADCSARSAAIMARAQELMAEAGIDGRRLKMAPPSTIPTSPSPPWRTSPASPGSPTAASVPQHHQPRFVDEAACTGCRLCEQACTVAVPDQFNARLVSRRAAYIPFP
jgi:NAD-dependent dihydropyrimidine dehydrogenase PreA subunit